MIVLDTQKVPPELYRYLPIVAEMFYLMPIEKDGKVLSLKESQKILNETAFHYDASFGKSGKPYNNGRGAYNLILDLLVRYFFEELMTDFHIFNFFIH